MPTVNTQTQITSANPKHAQILDNFTQYTHIDTNLSKIHKNIDETEQCHLCNKQYRHQYLHKIRNDIYIHIYDIDLKIVTPIINMIFCYDCYHLHIKSEINLYIYDLYVQFGYDMLKYDAVSAAKLLVKNGYRKSNTELMEKFSISSALISDFLKLDKKDITYQHIMELYYSNHVPLSMIIGAHYTAYFGSDAKKYIELVIKGYVDYVLSIVDNAKSVVFNYESRKRQRE